MKKLKVFLSESYNPHLNLATEEWIFHNLNPSQQVLFLWRNDNTVVIGRNQNPWTECNLTKMKEDGIYLARRTTGGGAVFHDLGNTNFTFLSPKEHYKRENNISIILGALKHFNIHGEASGRNDLTVSFADGPRKFSGSAYREKKDRAFHHGTLLINADLGRLANYLTPNPKKLIAKGKESVRARVANLQEINSSANHDLLCQQIIKSFENFYQQEAEIETLSLESLKSIQELHSQFESLSSYEWLYGHTLQFTHQMDEYLSLGFFDFQFIVEDAIIAEVKIYTDCLFPALVEDLRHKLLQQKYSMDSIGKTIDQVQGLHPEQKQGLEEIKTWLCRNIEV